MQTTNEISAHGSGLLTGEIQPVAHSVQFAMLDPADGTQAVAFDQHGHGIQKHWPFGAQGFKEGSFVKAKSMLTSGAVITLLSVAIDFDLLMADLPKLGTRFLIAPLRFSFHHASPQLA